VTFPYTTSNGVHDLVLRGAVLDLVEGGQVLAVAEVREDERTRGLT
jgi:hypothetical protein